MIKVTINNICAKLVECEPLTSGMIGKTLDVELSADWAGLSKTAVFSNGDKTIDVLESEWNGNTINIPWEVLETPNRAVSFGIYGYTKSGDDIILAIPTLYTSLGRVYLGTNPSGDESTEPSLPVYAQLDLRVTDLEEHGGGGIPEAPIDGKQYARQDGEWAEVVGGGESKWTSEATELLITILRNAAYKAEHDQSSNIEALDALLNETATLVSIEATYTQGATVVYPTTSLDSLKSELVVIATYDDESTVTLNENDYTLSGTLTEGTSTITATYQGKIDTFIVEVSAEPVVPTLDYISAVYSGGDVVEGTMLETLKNSLVVTAHYTDESTETLESADYTLSGNLNVGTNIITVTYSGKSTTFEVTVTSVTPTTQYALHQVAGYGGQFDTGKSTQTDHVAKVEVTLEIPQPETTNTKVIFSGFLGWFGFSNNEWKAEHPVEGFAVDRPFSDVVGNGKQTITITGLGSHWAMIKTGYSTYSFNPELTWYEIKLLDASDNVIADWKPTANVGEMYDSVSDSTSNFSTTTGLTVSEVTA